MAVLAVDVSEKDHDTVPCSSFCLLLTKTAETESERCKGFSVGNLETRGQRIIGWFYNTYRGVF